jgi:hypothetical protein
VAVVGHPAVSLATTADHDRVIDTVVAAFVADPVFRYFFPEEETYAERPPSSPAGCSTYGWSAGPCRPAPPLLTAAVPAARIGRALAVR